MDTHDRAAHYVSLARQLESLLEGERDLVANAANTSAFVAENLSDLNWAGFYFLRGDELVLGPFQGKVACVRIGVGKGVCGTSVAQDASIVVEDVHAFDGHIACDSASNSELVVPLRHAGRVVGVLDLDSPSLRRFDDVDREGVEKLVAVFERATDLSVLDADAARATR